MPPEKGGRAGFVTGLKGAISRSRAARTSSGVVKVWVLEPSEMVISLPWAVKMRRGREPMMDQRPPLSVASALSRRKECWVSRSLR